MKKKKITLCAFLCCLLVLSSGCSFLLSAKPSGSTTAESDTATAQQITTVPSYTDGNVYFSVDEFEHSINDNYEKLSRIQQGKLSLINQTEKDLYSALEKSIHEVSYVLDSETNSYRIKPIYLQETEISEAQIHIVLLAFGNDYPEIFWLENYFSYLQEDSSMYIQFYSPISPSEIQQKMAELSGVISEMLLSIPEYLSEYERELFIHNKIAQMCEYDYDEVNGDDKNWESYTLYGTLVSGLAVCEGYARTLQYLLRCCGIESYGVFGSSDGQLHKWNLVKIDDKWYHVDLTWNDINDNLIWEYFNLTDSMISKDHQIATHYSEQTNDEITKRNNFNFDLPLCTAEYANFYKMEALFLNDLSSSSLDNLTEYLIENAGKENTVIYIQFPESITADDACASLFKEEPYSFFRCIDKANVVLQGKPIDTNEVYVKIMDTSNVLKVSLSYLSA